MRIAIIGTGGIAADHLKALSQIQEVTIVGVAGRDLAKAKAKACPYDAAAFGDWRAMLAQARPDAVYICLPPKIAADTSIECAGRVRGVMVEKPVASEVDSAERVASAFAREGTIAGAAYHNRVRAVVGRIQDLCAEQPPVMAEAFWHGEMPPPLRWRTRAISGGQMTEQCTHLIDLLRVWLGEAVQVSAVAAHGTMAKEVEGFGVDDALSGSIQFASGAIASVHTSCIAKKDQGIAGVGMTLRARGWEAQLSGWGLDATIRFAGGREETLESEPDVFRRQAEAFVSAVRSGDASRLPCRYDDAVETLKLTKAIDASAREGRSYFLKSSSTSSAAI